MVETLIAIGHLAFIGLFLGMNSQVVQEVVVFFKSLFAVFVLALEKSVLSHGILVYVLKNGEFVRFGYQLFHIAHFNVTQIILIPLENLDICVLH